MDKSEEIFGAAKKIKKEHPNEELNEFAETAMNELLGWYGYGASRDESKMHPRSSCNSQQGSNSSDPESPKCSDGCEWCGKSIDENKALVTSGSTFCSDLCFSQSRRANFKKNKTCDWCRHVRHTVSYVDFQDGASQLQFCSDKCLNQYKMHIFCRETRAHLELHPHLPDDAGSVGGLITPDLWLRNCKSPEQHTPSPPTSPKLVDNLPQTSPLPLIRVAHPSKFAPPLIDSPTSPRKPKVKTQRKQRKKCCATTVCSTPPSDSPQDLRIRHSPPLSTWEKYNEHNFFRNPRDYHNHPFNNFPKYAHNPSFNPLHPPPLPFPPQPPPNPLPPVTVLVPYPIIIPIPLPIPIPITVTSDGKIKIPGTTSQKNEETSPGENLNDKSLNTTPISAEENEETEMNENAKKVRKRKRIVAVDPKIKLETIKSKKIVPV